MPPRIAFIDYFPTHYRKRLYEELAKRTDADFYFFADEQRDRTWNRKIPIRQNTGAYRRIEYKRFYLGGQAVMPAVSPSWNGVAPEILYVGQFEERKGLAYLIEAFEALSRGSARLRLVGNGSQEEWLRSRVAGRDDVEIVGYRPQDELPGEIARARCLVLPSITTNLDKEPWGLVVNEAMHVGIPVVTSDAVGAAAGGLVQDGRNGYIVPERDSASLSAALASLVDD